MRLRLLERAEPKKCHAHSHLHTRADLLILRVGAVVQLAVPGLVPEVQDLDGASTVLQALLKVPEVQSGHRAVGEAPRVGAQLERLGVGVVGSLHLPPHHELIALVLEPDRVILVPLLIARHHGRELGLWRILREGRRLLAAVPDRDAWPRARGEAHADLPRVVPDLRHVLFCLFQALEDVALILLRLIFFFHCLLLLRLLLRLLRLLFCLRGSFRQQIAGVGVEGAVDLLLPLLPLLFLPFLNGLPVLRIQAPLRLLAVLQHLMLEVLALLEPLRLPQLQGLQRLRAALPELRLGASGPELAPDLRAPLLQRHGDLIRAHTTSRLGMLRVDLMEEVHLEERGRQVHLHVDVADGHGQVLRLDTSRREHKDDGVLILTPIEGDLRRHRRRCWRGGSARNSEGLA
mmetsp:Transcript_99847/g.237970  ORF Transcript_99847/g.237970 Transcript_99847/m.237970 type:complete len:404 (-) Transcript_99847:2-1213(-)